MYLSGKPAFRIKEKFYLDMESFSGKFPKMVNLRLENYRLYIAAKEHVLSLVFFSSLN